MLPRYKLQTYLKTREDQARIRWEEKQRGNSLQQVFTPFSLSYEMLERLPSLEGKDVLVVANMETFYLLKYLKVDGYINFNSVTLLTDIKKLEGKEGVSYNSFDELDKVNLGMKFDVVIGNPPYQQTTGSKEGKPIWQNFVSLGIDLLSDDGLVCMIHPNGYRQGKSSFQKIFNKMKQLHFNYLKLSNYDTGVRLFGVNTSCDWYVLSKKSSTEPTTVVDIEGKVVELNISELTQVPDSLDQLLLSIVDLTGNNTVDILYDTSYHTQKEHLSKTQDSTYKFPVVYTLKQDGPSLWFSAIQNKGHYGVPKVIMARGLGEPVLDLEGNFATAQFGFAITGDVTYLQKVYAALKDKRCIDFLTKLGTGTGHNYLKEVLRMLKKDFWKEFVD